MDLDSPKYPVIIWQCSKCPALGAQWLLWLFEFGWLHANILRKKILTEVHIHLLSWVYHFCKMSCCCQENFEQPLCLHDRPLEGWGEHRCLFKRIIGQGGGNVRPQMGKRVCRVGQGQELRGRISPWPQRHLFTVGDGFFRCCLLSFCCWESQLLPGHWA